MGTTLTGVVVREDELFVVQVGDSRCYLLRGGQMQQVTEDHSWVQEQVNRGVLTLEDAELSPFRNVITRSLGAAPEVEPDLFAVKLEVEDRLVLCSDGLSGMMSDGELFDLAAHGSPSVAAWGLVDRAVENGGKDNVTVLVLDVRAIVPWSDAAETVDAPRQAKNADVPAAESEVRRIAAVERETERREAPERERQGADRPAGVWGRASGAFRKGLFGK